MTTQDAEAPPTPAGPPPTPNLNAALAAAQAEMPPIAKDETGKISGTDKYGKPFSYEYSYADLSGLTAVAYPIFGKHGLSFSAQPTLTGDGKFVLRYQLRHESGESLDGVMPLPSAAKPQDLGTILTYYRRYVFCAVTGIHPGGDDDDASSANNVQQYDRPQSAAEAFASAAPARPRDQRPERTAPPVQVPPLADDDPWKDKISGIADRDEAADVYAEVAEMRKAGTIDDTRAARLGSLITATVANLGLAARNSAPAAAAGTPTRIRAEDQGSPPEPPAAVADETVFVTDFQLHLDGAAKRAEVEALQRELGQAVVDRKILPDTAAELGGMCRDRWRALPAAVAAA